MAGVKVRLRFPTLGARRGDVVEVEKSQAAALVANGSARLVPVEKSVKD